jgi:tetratricopeptide (TPR) repeat protein
MRRSYRFVFSLALPFAACALLASCLTASAPRSLTIELFDSTAKHSPAISDIEMAVPQLPWQQPVQGPVSAGGGQGILGIESPLKGADPDLTALLILPAAPSAPSIFPAVLGLDASRAAKPASGFRLLAPEAPAAKTQPVAAAATAATAATAAAPASATTRAAAATTVARSPAVSAAATAPAPAAAATAAAAPSPAAATTDAPASSYGRLREIYARQGDELQIGLDGAGFLFLGFPDRGVQADGMSFKSKENRSGKTWFTFKALKLGIYDLDFQQQDNTSGTTSRETVRVHVVSDGEFSASTDPQHPVDSTGAAAEQGDGAFAERLSSAGAYQAAIAELQKGYREGDPALNDRIALLYLRLGSYEAAAKYFQKNLGQQGPFADSAVVGLMKIAVAQKDHPELLGLLKRFLAVKDASSEETLVQAARMEASGPELGVALDLAAEYALRFPEGRWRDEADFLLANLLEKDSQFRDLARSRELYAGILLKFPESAFAQPAQERLLYIERHFFQVR